MYVARILYPVKVLGPNNRLGIWLSICKHKCPGCSNPELWKKDEKQNVSVDDIFKTILSLHQHNKIDGFTITGGDPFYQSKELNQLVQLLSTISDDIIIYTGFKIEQLKQKNNLDINNILNSIAVLIDGKYIQNLNDNSFLVGSNNQRKIILNKKYESIYNKYFQLGENEIQNFILSDGIISVGIHKKDFNEKFKEELNYGKN